MTIQTEKTSEMVRHTFTTDNGGSVTITIFNKGNTKMLFGLKNPKGMGFFKNLTTEAEIKKQIDRVKDIIWLSTGEQYAIIEVMLKAV